MVIRKSSLPMMLTLMSLSSLPWALRMITWERCIKVFSDLQEQLYVPVEMCYLVNTRFLSSWVDHRKVNAVSPGITMLSEVLFLWQEKMEILGEGRFPQLTLGWHWCPSPASAPSRPWSQWSPAGTAVAQSPEQFVEYSNQHNRDILKKLFKPLNLTVGENYDAAP